MMHTYFLYLATGLAALISVIVWIDYFRWVDVFESEKLRHLAVALLVGCGTPFLCLQVYDLFDYIHFKENGDPINDLLFSIFGIGMNEELSKIVGVIIAFQILKKQINESIDHLIYAGMVALGFALVENFTYIERYGIDIITERSFYSVLEHIINTSLIVYGYYRFKVFNKGNQMSNTLIAFFAAISSHGLFDYFILNPYFSYLSHVLVLMVYLIGINFWITMLNNAINFSNSFNYSHINYSGSIFYRLILWYFFTMLIGMVYIAYTKSLKAAFLDTSFHLISDGFLFVIVILRASRFKIYKNYYQKVTIKLPFYITKNQDEDFILFGRLAIKIRGENAFEYYLTSKIGQKIELCPVNLKKSFLHKTEVATVCDKLFLKGETTVYVILFEKNKNDYYFLKPKTRDKTKIDGTYPIHQLMQDTVTTKGSKMLSELRFIEWVYLRTENEVSQVNY